MSNLHIKPKSEFRRDLVSLGEVLLRFDSGTERIHKARSFRVWDGGGEYNVAVNLSRVFQGKTAIVTALADHALGRLAEDFIKQSGVDDSQIVWRSDIDQTRNGIYFMEQGFGLRAPNSCFDRSHTATSQLQPGDVDWRSIFVTENSPAWFHTGGVFTGLSLTTPETALEAMKAANESGIIVSYDLNYRDSLWKNRGGKAEANNINRRLLPYTDVVFGIFDFETKYNNFDEEEFRVAAERLQKEFPNLKIIATTLREVISASEHNLSAACFGDGEIYKARDYKNVSVLDRVGSGDAFAAGFIYGLLNDKGIEYALECGTACGVLTMTTPGDNSTATLKEIEQLMQGSDATAIR